MHAFLPRLAPPLAVLALLLAAPGCGGGGGLAATGAPSNLQYTVSSAVYREGAPIATNAASWSGGAPTDWSVLPALPTGLLLDPLSGALSGTPAVEGPPTQHVVTASNAAGQAQATLNLAVMPDVFVSLSAGFTAETVHEAPAMTPVKHGKVTVAPGADGRVFFTEVDTGNVRVIDPTLGLAATPFASIRVLQNGHHGLLGLALAPDFAVSMTPHLYVLASVPGVGMTSDRLQVRRYTAVGNVGTNETVVLDDLPVAPPMGINNGGEIGFDAAGNLLVSIGDVGLPSNAQAPSSTSLAGKLLRYDVSQVPAVAATGNPTAGDPEWCRGLRNTFGFAVHPMTGAILGVDNGPAAGDELNFLQAGKNFEWGGSAPGGQAGYTIQDWPTVIVPTGLAWHDGTGWGAAYANNLFLCSYDDQRVRRFVMSGIDFADIDAETQFAELELSGDANHPLDVHVAPDGSLYVSTFVGIYRITKL